MLHYVEKPSSFISTTINCGIYLFSLDLFHTIGEVFRKRHADLLNGGDAIQEIVDGVNGVINGENNTIECISLEEDILMPLSQTKNFYVFRTSQEWWSQIKSPGSAIYANRYYLKLYRKSNPELLSAGTSEGPKIIGDVFIHPTASIDATATVSLFGEQCLQNNIILLECF